MIREELEFQPLSEQLNYEELVLLLKGSGVSTEEWGTADSKGVDDLLDEINSGESTLEVIDGVLTRKISVVRSHIFYIVDSDTVSLLRADRQFFRSDGRVRRRNLEQAVGGKIKLDEEPEEAMINGIHEALGIDGELEIMKGLENSWKGRSINYPGLVSEKTIHSFRTIISEAQYNPDGYMEKGEAVDSYYVWHDIEQIEY